MNILKNNKIIKWNNVKVYNVKPAFSCILCKMIMGNFFLLHDFRW
jgi:hypothetical protein